MVRFARFGLALAVLATGGASAQEKKPAQTFKPGAVNASGVYRLSADEEALDCKKLAGRMQVRMLQVRSYDPNRKPSDLGRTLQNTVAPILGASTVGANPDAGNRADRAMLEAYNLQLKAKGCRTFDLAAELSPQGASVLPTNSGKAQLQTPAPRGPASGRR